MDNLTLEKDVLDHFRVSRSTLWKWRKAGAPSVKIGRRVYYNIDAMVDWWRKQGGENNGCTE